MRKPCADSGALGAKSLEHSDAWGGHGSLMGPLGLNTTIHMFLYFLYSNVIISYLLVTSLQFNGALTPHWLANSVRVMRRSCASHAPIMRRSCAKHKKDTRPRQMNSEQCIFLPHHYLLVTTLQSNGALTPHRLANCLRFMRRSCASHAPIMRQTWNRHTPPTDEFRTMHFLATSLTLQH